MSNQEPEFRSTELWVNHGQSDKSIVSFSKQRIQPADIENTLIWLEPAEQLNVDGSAGRLHSFSPFVEAFPDEFSTKLVSAYIWGCYEDSPWGLHIIADEPGCRRFEFSISQQKGFDKLTVSERKYPVLTRRDFKRFFGERGEPEWCAMNKLSVTEYWTNQGLLAWWLSAEKQ